MGRREELLEKYNKDEDGGLRAWMELGDEHPDFRYTLWGWTRLQFLWNQITQCIIDHVMAGNSKANLRDM